MGKSVADVVLDAALNVEKGATELYITAGQPTSRANAITLALASRTGLTGASFTGPADGDVSGRKVTKNAESGISIGTSGTADHVALCDGTTLLQVTTCSAQALTSGGTVSTNAYKHEIADPT